MICTLCKQPGRVIVENRTICTICVKAKRRVTNSKRRTKANIRAMIKELEEIHVN